MCQRFLLMISSTFSMLTTMTSGVAAVAAVAVTFFDVFYDLFTTAIAFLFLIYRNGYVLSNVLVNVVSDFVIMVTLAMISFMTLGNVTFFDIFNHIFWFDRIRFDAPDNE